MGCGRIAKHFDRRLPSVLQAKKFEADERMSASGYRAAEVERPIMGDSGRSAILAKHRRRFVRLLNSPSGMKAITAIECLRNRFPAVRSMILNAGA